MICHDAIQLLPWLLNGTLPAAEEREVREHLGSCESCRDALGETRRAYEIFTAHVPSGALVAYAWGRREADGVDADLIERHLEDCPQCAAELELVRTSRQLEEEPEIALLRPTSARPDAPPIAVPVRPARARGWQASALAATLGGAVALAGWIHSNQQRSALETELGTTRESVQAMTDDLAGIRTQLESVRKEVAAEASSPTAAPAAGTTTPAEPPATGGGSAGPGLAQASHLTLYGAASGLGVLRGDGDEAAIARGDAYATLEIQTEDPSPRPERFEIALLRDGRKVATLPVSPIVEDRILRFTFGFEPARYGAGRYTVVLTGIDGGRRSDIDTFEFPIR